VKIRRDQSASRVDRFTHWCWRTLAIGVFFSLVPLVSFAAATWQVLVPNAVARDSAVLAGLEELRRTAKNLGLSFAKEAHPEGPKLVLSLTDSSSVVAQLGKEGFRWYKADGELRLEAGTELGLAYGLFQLADEVATTRAMPSGNRTLSPSLPYRVLEVGRLVPSTLQGPSADAAGLETFRRRWRGTLVRALRHGYNILRLHATEDFVPWEDPRYGPRSVAYRAYLKAAVEMAHAFHLKVLVAGDEFIYLPELVGGRTKTLSVKENTVWDGLAKKYRRLLRSAPYLDGVSTRIGEVIPYYDFRHFDLIHAPADSPDPRIEERYRRFLWTMYRVVVGEFGKLYLHRTWVTNNWEQHSVPEIYRRTFEGLPTDNLLVAIKITKTDQWYYWVPFNPTFGVTPHTTLAQAELGSAAHGSGLLLDFPGFWFGAGLRYAVGKGARGVLASVTTNGPGQEAVSYVFARLAWEPDRSVSDLLLRWLRRTYGDSAAPALLGVFRKSAEAIRDGLYVRPWALQEWNPIPHLRVRTFMFGGRPLFDHGKGHDRFLRTLYLQAEPWGDETLNDLDRGLETADSMLVAFQRVEAAIPDSSRRARLDHDLHHELVLLRLNRAYVADILRYFRYKDTGSSADRKALARANARLSKELRFYKRYFGAFDVRALEILLSLSKAAVHDLPALKDSLRSWPDEAEVEAWFVQERQRYKTLLAQTKHPHVVYHWKGTIDGSDLLTFVGDSVHVEHFLWEYPRQAEFAALGSYDPDEEELVIRVRRGRGTVVLVPGKAKRGVAVYVEDPAPGVDVYDFEVVAVKRPEKTNRRR